MKKKKKKESTVCIMITNLPKGLLWEIQSQREHRDRLTLIMFRSLKCSKSQTWLHIYEAKMHLLFILGSSLNFETLCGRPRQLWNHRKFVLCCSKRFPPVPLNCVYHGTDCTHYNRVLLWICYCLKKHLTRNFAWRRKNNLNRGHCRYVCSPDVTTLVCSV